MSTAQQDEIARLRELVEEHKAEIGLRDEIISVNATKNDQLRKVNARLTKDLAEVAQHRDAWRGYAYGRRSRPEDFIGDRVPETSTAISRMEEALKSMRNLAVNALTGDRLV